MVYHVQSSPGKGLGCFATKPIKPGTLILRDRMTMRIRRPELDVTEKQVGDALNELNNEDQKSFLKLHEGRLPYETQNLRIFKANAFGDETYAWLCLKIARLNHLAAIKPISKGEEIFISYNGSLEEGSKVERAQVMRETYGFECYCPVCILEGQDANLSDARRRLINAISHKLAGFEPSHLCHISNVNSSICGDGLKVVGRYKQRLRAPLTASEKVAYNLLLAGLLEAEGLIGFELAKSYVTAAFSLLGQLHELKAVVVLPSAKFVEEWMSKGIEIMKKIRSNGSRNLNELLQAWKVVQKSAHLRLAKSFLANPKPFIKSTGMDPATTFAIKFVGTERLLTQEQCRELLKLYKESGELI